MIYRSRSLSFRVYRGGSCYYVPRYARIALCDGGTPDICGRLLGLRLMRRCT